MTPPRRRLDQEVVRRGLARSRHRAKQLIVGGHIRVQGAVVTKAATPVSEQQALEVDAQALPYVSRAGNKLDFALSTWDLPVQGATCLDVGASTGGFTDVLLRRGALQSLDGLPQTLVLQANRHALD